MSTTRPQRHDGLLAAFIGAYVDEDAPACILHVSGDSSSRKIFDVTASNAAFTDVYKKQLEQALPAIPKGASTILSTKDIRWNLTTLTSKNEEPGSDHTIVCIGRRQDQNETQTDSDGEISSIPAVGTSQDPKAMARYNDTKQPLHYSVGKSSAEEWLQEWSKMELPGVDKAAFLDHIDLIRKVDWSKTPLGPMDTWSIVFLSTLGQALASPFPVLLAWGPELTQIYNLPYSHNIAAKHPRNMGKSYADAWPEVWEYLTEPTSNAMKGKATHVNNAQMFLQRKDYLEECYFTWSMTPIFDDDRKIAGIYIPNFDNTLAVVTERRLKLLREASQAQGVETKPAELYQRICSATTRNPIDIPLLVFYDSSAADDERDMSEDTSERVFELTSQMDEVSHHEDELRRQHGDPRNQVQSASGEAPSNGDDRLRVPADGHHQPTHAAIESLQRDTPANVLAESNATKQKALSEFVRAAYTGCEEHSLLFPPTIPPPAGEAHEESIATHPVFLRALRTVQTTHQHVILQKEDMQEFTQYLDKTVLGDEITTLAIMPITTSDDTVRGICIVGLNPRKAYSEDYQVFLDLFQAQVNHGVTSIRLVGEELRRSRFFATLIKRKNEELHVVLNARTEELRNSEQKFVKMAEICPSGIWTVDHRGSVTFVNEAWYTITGHSRDKSLNSWPETIHPDDRVRCETWFKRVLESTEPIHPIEFRWRQQPGEGVQRWTWADARHDIGEHGEIVTITGTLTDITEKKAVELHQQQRAEEAIQMRRAQEGFVDMTSHELRNPLSAISLSSDATTERLEHMLNTDSAKTLMSLYKTEVEDTLQDMKIINHCCVHMTRLIDDVLTLSKLDNQFLVITPVPCRPADFISETLSIFKGEMLSKDITCELEIKPSFVANKVDYVLTDPSRINQLVINILTNAIKFTAAAKVRRVKVTLDCSPTKPTTAGTSMQASSPKVSNAQVAAPSVNADDVYLLVSVSDTGRGLTQDEIGHLFQRFRQANPKTHISYGGSGLGLHICKRITELLGGEIGVESIRGRGSTFTFYIPTKRALAPLSAGGQIPSPGLTNVTDAASEDPVAKAFEGSRHSRPLSSPGEELGNSFEKLALLIVEDNLINQRLLDKHLTRVGCVTTCANHGQEALDLIRQSKWVRSDGPTIDCILMDIEMPVMDGLTAIQEIRRMEESGEIQGHIPVLAVTANARQEQLDIMLGSGFDGTISKPFKVPIIMDRVRTLLRELRQKNVSVHKAKRTK